MISLPQIIEDRFIKAEIPYGYSWGLLPGSLNWNSVQWGTIDIGKVEEGHLLVHGVPLSPAHPQFFEQIQLLTHVAVWVGNALMGYRWIVNDGNLELLHMMVYPIALKRAAQEMRNGRIPKMAGIEVTSKGPHPDCPTNPSYSGYYIDEVEVLIAYGEGSPTSDIGEWRFRPATDSAWAEWKPK